MNKHPVRTATYIVAVVGILCTTTALIARQVPITNHIVVILAAVYPYLATGAAIATPILLITRRWLTATAAIALTVAAVATQLPLFTKTTPPEGPQIRVFTVNVLDGHADPKALVDIATDKADVVVVEELTPGLAQALSDRGIEKTFPYETLAPGEWGYGVGIFSRYPITVSEHIDGFRLKMVSAYIAIPGTQQETVFVATHLPGPWPQDIGPWREEIQRLPATLADIKDAANGRPVIVAGDFNATYDMAPFRKLLTNGYADAAEQSGAGITRTFPADETVPPLLGIDHILTDNATATDVQTQRVPGSDHLGLLATVRLTPLR